MNVKEVFCDYCYRWKMNKQEFQETIRNMEPPKHFSALTFKEAFNEGFNSAKNNALFDSCFLNEPEKPVLPQFVVDWIEWCKNNNVTLLGAMSPIDELGTAICDDKKVKSLDASKWATQNQETFAKAWLFGYEVEKEKLYTVELPSPNCQIDDHYILSRLKNGKIIINRYCIEQWEKFGDCQLTESEIKKDFEWAWQFAKEVKE